MNTRSIYRKIVRENGITAQEVKDEIQKAIDAAWDNPKKTKECRILQNRIKEDGKKPTPEELMAYGAGIINMP